MLAPPILAQLDQTCTVSVLNRTAPVDSNGIWVLTNVPTGSGQTRVRAARVTDGSTRYGRSGLFTVPVKGTVLASDISFAIPVPIASSLDGAAGMQNRIEHAGQSTNCTWMALSKETLLSRHLGSVDLRDGDLREIFEDILASHGVPASYIEADEHPPITLRLTNPTVRELFDALIAQSPRYRYAFLCQHLVFYPRAAPYDAPLPGVVWPALSRMDAAYRLVKELQHRYAEFAKLEPPLYMGQPQDYLFADVVTLTNPTSVVDALAQLLGNRPSACFVIPRRSPSFFVAADLGGLPPRGGEPDERVGKAILL